MFFVTNKILPIMEIRLKFFQLVKNLAGKNILIVLPQTPQYNVLFSSFALKFLLEQTIKDSKVHLITNSAFEYFNLNRRKDLAFLRDDVMIKKYKDYVEEYGIPDAVFFLGMVDPTHYHYLGGISSEVFRSLKQVVVFTAWPEKFLQEPNCSVFSLPDSSSAEIISVIFEKFLYPKDKKFKNFEVRNEIYLALFLSIFAGTKKLFYASSNSLLTAGKLTAFLDDAGLQKLESMKELCF